MNLDWLLGLPKSGVVILKKGGSVLVAYTTSMGAHLESLYQQFGGQSGVTMEVVSAGADIETLKLHTEYYRDYYIRQGFTSIQSHSRKAIQYRVRAVPSSDFKFVDVELVSARGDAKFVGRFRSMRLAGEFIETYYGTDNPFKLPVYAANSDTKLFLQKTKMLDIK